MERRREETRREGKQWRQIEVVIETGKETKDQERTGTETGRDKDERDQEKETGRKKSKQTEIHREQKRGTRGPGWRGSVD